MEYMWWHWDDVQVSFVGDAPERCGLFLFCDASFASDIPHSESTSGAFLALVGSNTFCPITWLVKRQGAVTHSSSEAEIVSLDAALRTVGLPCVIFWDIVVGMLAKHNETTKPDDRHSELAFQIVADIIDDFPRILPPLKNRTFCNKN